MSRLPALPRNPLEAPALGESFVGADGGMMGGVAGKEDPRVNTNPQYQVGKTIRTAFESDGAVPLRDIVDKTWLERLRHAIDRNRKPDDWYFKHIYVWQRDPDLAEFCFHSHLPQAASQLLNSEKLNLIHDQVFVKEQASEERTDWHNDGPYWPINGPALSIWLAIDEVSEDTGSLEFIRGSHRWDRWFATTGPILPSAVNPKFEKAFDFETEGDAHEIISWDLAPGDAVAFHKLTVHGARAYRRQGFRRRAYALRFAAKGSTYTNEAGAAPHFCNPDLREGQLLDSEKYPVVFGG